MDKKKKEKLWRNIVFIIVFIGSIVTLFDIFNNGKNISNSEEFIKELELKGYKVESNVYKEEEYEVINGKKYGSYKTGHRKVTISGKTLTIYEFESEDIAKKKAKSIPSDGSVVISQYIGMLGNPHVYRKGKIIVLYEGRNPKMLWDLRLILGMQIAGMKWYDIIPI
ncbi:hypothetical protein KQI89_17085 [Clostridium sp. MSJ-4]|uniref:Uncharacterized protein n=1 Tax=Clostridium simiarum TaxID=2841506 RepID=A0ABS6F4L2_9CLOT|nr:MULTISPECIES: hypothetical protein [Clostridium]MBU5593457.1 hypothetical protein [Clostridium simiarum]